MIFDAQGDQVEITAVDRIRGEVTIRRVKDGRVSTSSMWRLNADGGQPEIRMAIQAVEEKQRKDKL